jgi:hypothetical protein
VSNYTKTTNFTSKDSLSTGNPLKIVRGAEHDTEYNNIATAIQTKADLASPALTGTATAVNITVSGNLLVGSDTATTNTATQTLTNKTIALGSNTVSGTTAQFNTALTDGDFATLAGTESLSNKTITSSTLSSNTITGGSVDNTTIGTTTRSSVKATTLDLGLSTQSVAIGQGNASIMKNRIINGAMVIDQRNAGASVTPTANTYTLDRWLAVAASAASKFSVQQNAGSVTPPAGFTNYLGVTSLSAYSVSASDFLCLIQSIEGYNIADLGWGTANAKTVTLSFWVRSSLTGTFGGALSNSAGDRSYPFTYTISAANIWEQKSITIAGDTSGTWLTTNGIGVSIKIGLGVGSTYSGTAGAWAGANYFSATGATNIVATNGATLYLTGIQLEVGSSATGYEYRQYGQELTLCQRYFETSYDAGTAVGASANGMALRISGASNNYILQPSWYKVSKRATPTVTLYDPTGASGKVKIYDSSTDPNGQSYTITQNLLAGFNTNPTPNCQGAQFNYTSSAEL